jgi:hypothetical protein
MSSVTKHALEVAGFVVIVAAIFEFQLAGRRASTPNAAEPDLGGSWSYRRQWSRIRYEGTYGAGITAVRVIELAVVGIALLVALILAIAG